MVATRANKRDARAGRTAEQEKREMLKEKKRHLSRGRRDARGRAAGAGMERRQWRKYNPKETAAGGGTHTATVVKKQGAAKGKESLCPDLHLLCCHHLTKGTEHSRQQKV